MFSVVVCVLSSPVSEWTVYVRSDKEEPCAASWQCGDDGVRPDRQLKVGDMGLLSTVFLEKPAPAFSGALLPPGGDSGYQFVFFFLICLSCSITFTFSHLAQRSSTLVLRAHCPARFRCFPAPTHLIQMNGR